jgi:hypothetical protein
MPIQTTTIKLPLSAPPQEVREALAAFFTEYNPCDLMSFRYRRADTASAPDAEVQITIRTPGASTYQVEVFRASGVQTADLTAEEFFAANPDYRAVRVIDLTPINMRLLTLDAVCVVYLTDGMGQAIPGLNGMRFMRAEEDIAAGEEGDAQIWTENGGTGDIKQTQNRGQDEWSTGTFGWGAPDPATGQWAAIPE